MSKKQKTQAFLVLSAAVLPLAILLVLRLDPSMMAAASGWYGYNNLPVTPEPTAFTEPLHGVRERNNDILGPSGDVILYLNGVLKYQADGISVPSPGFGFGYHLTYNNNHEHGTNSADDGDINLPTGWNWHSGIFHLVDMGSGELRLVGRGMTSSKYQYNSQAGAYLGQNGVDSKIVQKTSSNEFLLHATNGATVYFHDFDSSQGGKKGALKKILDAAGNQLVTTYYSVYDSSNLADLLKELTDAGGHKWVFTYIDNTGNANNKRVQKVEVLDGETVLARAEYLYYNSTSGDFASGSGTNGDLMRIIVTERDSSGLNLKRTTLFRYWAGSYGQNNDKGASHKLKYIVGPESYSELAASVADPLKATDQQVSDHADYALEYNTSSFVTKATVRGSGCSCSTGAGTYQFSFATNGSWTTGSGYDVWKVSVTQTNPDGTVSIVDVNKAGMVLNDIFQTDASFGTGDQRWIRHHTIDSAARITASHHPSACSSYSSHAVTLNSSSGLVDLFTYDSSGNLTQRKIKEGSSGTPYWLEKRAYLSKTLGDNTIQFLSSRTVYPSETTSDTGGKVTVIDYTFHPDSLDLDGDQNTSEDSLLVKEMTVTHPAVPAAENGENETHTRKSYFNGFGQLQWEKDEMGSISYREYHADLGTLTRAIADMDTDGVSPPTGYTNSTGLSLTTDYAYQADGKLIERKDPELRTERYHYTKLSTGEPVTLSYPHVGAQTIAGPVSIAIYNFDGKLITRATGVPADGDTNLDDDFDETEATLEAAFAGDLYSRTESVYSGGQKLEEHVWTDASNPNAQKYVTTFGYDDMGRLARVKDAGGTITRTYYTVAGRVAERAVGTNDYLMGDPLGETSGTNNMTTLEEIFYDDEEDTSTNAGDGNVTRVKKFVSGSSSRDMDYGYDWRNRRITADGEESFFEKIDYDNLNRVVVRYRYQSSESSGNLRAKSETKYDTRGRVFQTIVHEVSPTSGAIDDALTTNFWYSARGDLLKKREPSGVFTKNLYDSARRLEKTYVSYQTTGSSAYEDADDVDGDTVVLQTKFDRDQVGNVLLETRWERNPTGTTTGELTTSSAVRFYKASWYDVLHRLVATGNYGTNGGSTLTRPGSAPGSSDTVLVTSYAYNDQGLTAEVTDPEDHLSYREYDNLGRLVTVVDNYVDGTPGSGDDDRKQEMVYDAMSRLIKRKTWMTNGNDPQETEWVYGVAKGNRPDSDLASNNLLKTIKYPDPSSGSPSSSADDQESFAYNAQGDVVYKKDQNGTVHEYDYDELGRRTADKVTTLGTGVDGAIRRIQTLYDALDRPGSIESYDAATGGSVKNDLEFSYNGFGQVTESRQEHNGAMTQGSLKVIYSYSEAENGDPISRLTSVQYPASGRVVYFHHDDPSGGSDHAKMDWILGRVSGVSNNSSISADRVGDYDYQGLSRVTKRRNSEPGSSSSRVNVLYSYDLFGRTQSIIAGSVAHDINSFAYGYNRSSQVLWREENYFSGKDELYEYDALHRLETFKRGDLNGERTDITPDYSPTG
jgi:YD repeat-containing protein